MRLSFPAHVHAAAIGEDLVLLDLAGDAYLCLPGAVTSLRPTADLRAVEPRDGADAAELRARGLLVDAPQTTPFVPPPPPTAGLPDDPPGPATCAERVALAQAMLELPTRYVSQPLPRLLARAERCAVRRPRVGDPAEVARLASIFRRDAVWLPMSRKCLVRSFVLLRFLQRCGGGAAWVFGVRTWPFGAHCWLQAGPVVLDDAPERLAPYVPILAVRG